MKFLYVRKTFRISDGIKITNTNIAVFKVCLQKHEHKIPNASLELFTIEGA